MGRTADVLLEPCPLSTKDKRQGYRDVYVGERRGHCLEGGWNLGRMSEMTIQKHTKVRLTLVCSKIPGITRLMFLHCKIVR